LAGSEHRVLPKCSPQEQKRANEVVMEFFPKFYQSKGKSRSCISKESVQVCFFLISLAAFAAAREKGFFQRDRTSRGMCERGCLSNRKAGWNLCMRRSHGDTRTSSRAQNELRDPKSQEYPHFFCPETPSFEMLQSLIFVKK